jgi:hypothetical protein
MLFNKRKELENEIKELKNKILELEQQLGKTKDECGQEDSELYFCIGLILGMWFAVFVSHVLGIIL